MREYAQWILWRLEKREDKLDKIPVSPHTLRDCDAHTPSNWTTFEKVQANRGDLGIGFVLADSDPFFFIDIDNCLLPTGQWMPNAVALCERFPGAEIEVSVSGKGLHIVSTGAPNPDYKIRAADGSFDIYYRKRMVTYQGTGHGNPGAVDHTGIINSVQRERFEKRFAGKTVGWSAEPDEEWNGPEDDDTLLNKMLASRSAKAAFGGVGIVDLWTGDEDKLGGRWPDPARAYDANAADGALLSHLAFWTGKDCARMDRLFRLSALYRDKWEDREDYRSTSILGAIAHCSAVYNDRPGEKEKAEGAKVVEGTQYMTVQEQIEYFSKCIYVRGPHRVLVSDGTLLKPSQFKATHGRYSFAMDVMGGRASRDAFEALTESQAIKHPWVVNVTFRPDLPALKIIDQEGEDVVNCYVKPKIKSLQGDASPFLGLLKKMLPITNDFEILLAYLAAIVQHPGVKFQWCPVIQGIEGNGKTMIIQAVEYVIGRKYCHRPNAKQLASDEGKFNAWLANRIFIGVEEIRLKNTDAADKLKPYITNDRIEIEGKGEAQYTGDNLANFILLSNHRDAVIKTQRDRRYAVFFTAQQNEADLTLSGMDGKYFPRLREWWMKDGYAIVAYFLENYAIPDLLNPAKLSHRAPVTSSTADAIDVSRPALETEILERIQSGEYGFRGGWISSLMFDRIVNQFKIRTSLSRAERYRLLECLGYKLHSGLTLGRGLSVPEEGGRPALYVCPGHPAARLKTIKAVTEAYVYAQRNTVA